ncbi:MAG TPA: TetR/AcrR family transcriptional regulator [Albitalea sp.]|nr:TetR/AcrR family transcriptional regulator [Albitalea sp.]
MASKCPETVPTQDRRVQRTRGLLHESLATLLREKSYESVSVKDILDRANVGRSTFYMHYGSKDELLASAMRDMLLPLHAASPSAAAGGPEGLVAFSRPVFEHVHRHHSIGKAPMGRKGRAILHEHLQSAVAERTGAAVKKMFAGRRKKTSAVPPELLGRYIATTFTQVLTWWLEGHSDLSPREVDAVFCALVTPTLQSLVAT